MVCTPSGGERTLSEGERTLSGGEWPWALRVISQVASLSVEIPQLHDHLKPITD